MARSCRIKGLLRPVVWAALLLIPAVLIAAERARRKPLPKGELVEIFSGIEQGQIEVQLIPRDSARANLLVRNKTDKPLNVVLPQAFAGVPVLAQFQDIIGDDIIRDGRRVNDARLPQQMGVGPGRNNWPWPGMMNVRGPNVRGPNVRRPNVPPGFWFNVAPEKVGKLELTGVCLEYGKPDPRPRFKYQIEPIRSVTDKPEVAELCAMLGRGEIGQRAAQLAAWHLNNDLSWQKLATMRTKLAVGTKPTYTQRELKAAKTAAEKATKLAEQRRQPSSGKAKSLSQR